jgi:DNA-binding NarL/FixJ family response regulator
VKTYSVVIVEDHLLLLQALESLVNSFDNFNVLYTCINGQEILDNLIEIEIKPDIVLMDINMPVLNGIEATRIIRSKHPDINIIGLSVENNDTTITKMLQAGACSYLVKDVEKKILEHAMFQVMSQGYYYTKKVSGIIKDLINPRKQSKGIQLNDRELEFIKYTCSDLTYNEIAEKMCLSPKTIDGYRDCLFKKLRMKNRPSLILYAIRNKIFFP